MAPTAAPVARRAAPATSHPGQSPAPRRPTLRLFEPVPRYRHLHGHRPTIWLSISLVVGSLLAVVVADGVVAQGQVRLSDIQHQVAAAVAQHKQLQVSVAMLAAPSRVVAQAERQGMVTPKTVVDLPQVPLDVPLPVPQTAPSSGVPAPHPPAALSPPHSPAPAHA